MPRNIDDADPDAGRVAQALWAMLEGLPMGSTTSLALCKALTTISPTNCEAWHEYAKSLSATPETGTSEKWIAVAVAYLRATLVDSADASGARNAAIAASDHAPSVAATLWEIAGLLRQSTVEQEPSAIDPLWDSGSEAADELREAGEIYMRLGRAERAKGLNALADRLDSESK